MELVVVMKDYQNVISDIIDAVENIVIVISNKYTAEELEEKLND